MDLAKATSQLRAELGLALESLHSQDREQWGLQERHAVPKVVP